jgi:hypothetical protein
MYRKDEKKRKKRFIYIYEMYRKDEKEKKKLRRIKTSITTPLIP